MIKEFRKKLYEEKGSIGLFFFLFTVLLYFQIKSVYGGDSGDYLSAAAVWGVPHQPGYPLFTFLAALIYRLVPLSTPAWRVALLSTIPAALTGMFLYKLLAIYFRKIVALISSLSFVFLYPVWLYSEIVEVFSLNNFFTLSLIYFTFKFQITKKERFFNLFLVFLGFAVAHHHIIVFIFPGLFWIWKKHFKKLFSLKKLLFLIPGLLFYAYLPIAASFNPPINWGGPSSLKRFLETIFRVGFGTFQANQFIIKTLWNRIVLVLVFFQYVFFDFGISGLFFVLLGIIGYFSIKTKELKTFWRFSMLTLGFYVFFIFYSSFPLYSNFNVATFERFLISPYLFLIILMAFGLHVVLKKVIKLTSGLNKKSVILVLFQVILFSFLPLSIFLSNYRKISILKNDFTAEKFSKDILDSAPEGSVVLLMSDTTWFNTSYVYYALEYRRHEIKYINPFILNAPYYQKYFSKDFPDLKFAKKEDVQENMQYLIRENPNVFIIPDNEVEGFKLIPNGLLFKYYPEDNLPSVDEVIAINDNLWQQYNDPLEGSLGKYKNLFLSDVLRHYWGNSMEMAEYLVENKKYIEAEKYLNKAVYYGVKDSQINLLFGRVYLNTDRCKKAEEAFLKAKEELSDNPFPDAYLRQVYINCYQDEKKAEEFLDSCFDKEKEQQIPLEDK